MAFSLTCVRRRKIRDRDAGLTEPSGLALAPGGRDLWTVSDDTRRVFPLSRKGKLRARRSFKVPAKDLEGIAVHPGGDILYAIRETGSEILEIDIRKRHVVERRRLADMAGYERIADILADDGANNGLEGITWNDDTGTLFCLREGPPGALIEVAPDLAGIRRHVMLDADNGFRDPADSERKVDCSGLCYDPVRGAFWIVSDRAAWVFLFSLDGGVLASAPLEYPRNGRFKRLKKVEGVAVDASSQRLFAVSDRTARLYAFDVRA